MTTYLYADGDLEVTRRNLFANPSFELDLTGVTYDLADFDSLLVEASGFSLAGLSVLRWTLSATPSATTSLVQQIEFAGVEPGQWVAARIPMYLDGWTGRVQVKIYPDAPAVGEGTVLDAPAGTWVYPTASFQVPGGATSVEVHVLVYGEVDDAPPAAAEGETDAWLAVVADTEAEALAALEPYFDGSTPDGFANLDDGLSFHEWDGEPDESTSTERQPIDPLFPKVVLNYRHDLDTGVTVRQPVTGLPVIVRRPATPRLPSGRLEMLCPTETLALDVQDLCNGTRLVTLVSDDVPGAPFTFSPTGQVQTAKNEPFSSWTVTVPYVRSTW